ncbi:MAG: sodium:solute symporter family protein [Gemmatimonadota bacterium]|nr:MAG: sodium:solute symporter family protein [Gemmatimonadota bacterium]
MTSLLGSIIALYLLAIFALSLYAGRRVKSEEDYIVAGRRLPLSLAWATLLATWFGAATILGAAEAARDEGVRGTILDPFASGAALIVAGLFFARPLWNMRLLTIADFYGRAFGRRAEVVASIILVPGYFGWIAAQYLALAGIQGTFFAIEPVAGILIAAAIILAYTLLGGMWSVTLTDALQMAVVLVTLGILGAVTFAQLGGGAVGSGIGRLLTDTPGDLLTFWPEAGAAAAIVWAGTWASGVFGNIPGQDLMQRVFASRDATTAVRACVLAGIIYIGFGLIPVGLGLASRLLFPESGAGEILTVLASQYLRPGLTVVFVVSLISIIVSTATSAVLSPATILGHNLLARLRPFRARPLFVDRLSVALVTLASVATAFSGRTILELLELSLSIGVVSLFVPLVAGLYGNPRCERQAILAMVFGTAVWLVREGMEGFVLPTSESAVEAGLIYAEHVAVYLGPERLASVWGFVAYAFALVPSAISGTAASLLGYIIGGIERGSRPDR